MHLECHAMLGWAIGNLGGADRPLRAWCVVGALLPDVDGLGLLAGREWFEQYHHTFGHNVFLVALFAGCAAWRFRTWPATFLALLAVGTHILSDAWLSGWVLYPFWPLSGVQWLPAAAIGLDHPFNIGLIYVGLIGVLALAAVYRRTPLDLFSPGLDQLLMGAIRPGTVPCSTCGRRGNQACARCGEPLCFRHARVGRRWETTCEACAKPSGQPV